jgi:hypothetical protein
MVEWNGRAGKPLEDSVRASRLFQLACALALTAAPTVPSGAETLIIQHRDGTSGTLTDLGGGIRLYTDSHGNSEFITDRSGGGPGSPIPTPQGSASHGPSFSVPSSPQGITPAPVLPFLPHGPLLPGAPPTSGGASPSGAGPSGFSSGAFSGRR